MALFLRRRDVVLLRWAAGPVVVSVASALHATTGAFGGIASTAPVTLVVGSRPQHDGGREPTPRGAVPTLQAVGPGP